MHKGVKQQVLKSEKKHKEKVSLTSAFSSVTVKDYASLAVSTMVHMKDEGSFKYSLLPFLFSVTLAFNLHSPFVKLMF